jgi:hypothetical protein
MNASLKNFSTSNSASPKKPSKTPSPSNAFRFFPPSNPNIKGVWVRVDDISKPVANRAPEESENGDAIASEATTCSLNSTSAQCIRKCITVGLDLDETLVHCFRDGASAAKYRDHPDYFEFKLGEKLYQCIKRPFLDEFIDKIFKIAAFVFVFTASTESYADEVVKNVFRKHLPDALFTREDCERVKGDIKKSLDLVYKSHPTVKENLFVMIDDRLEVYDAFYRDNVLNIDAWLGTNENDDSLKKIIQHLYKIRTCSGDIRKSLSGWQK